jgi:hypothetical protein
VRLARPGVGVGGGPRSTGRIRFGRRPIWVRHVFVAMVYSQERREERLSNRAEPAPGAEHRVLERVLRVVDGAQHAVGVGVELPAVGLHQAPERLLVPTARGAQQELVVGVGAGGGDGHPACDSTRPGGGRRPMSLRPTPGPRDTMRRAPSTPVVHLELHTGDRSGAADLYADLCGWRPEWIRTGRGSYAAVELGSVGAGSWSATRGARSGCRTSR